MTTSARRPAASRVFCARAAAAMRSRRARVLEELAHEARELRPFHVGVGHRKAAAGLDVGARVRGLVVLRGEGKRHEERRERAGGYLGERGGAGARHDDVGSGHGVAHLVGVAEQLPTLLLSGESASCSATASSSFGPVTCTTCTSSAASSSSFRARNRLVEVARAQAAARHQQHARVLGHAEARATRPRAWPRTRFAHGIARDATRGSCRRGRRAACS